MDKLGLSYHRLIYHSGGVRGIVELEVLAEIQRHLGRLKIGNFFDLIVGTRYAPHSFCVTLNIYLSQHRRTGCSRSWCQKLVC